MFLLCYSNAGLQLLRYYSHLFKWQNPIHYLSFLTEKERRSAIFHVVHCSTMSDARVIVWALCAIQNVLRIRELIAKKRSGLLSQMHWTSINGPEIHPPHPDKTVLTALWMAYSLGQFGYPIRMQSHRYLSVQRTMHAAHRIDEQQQQQ